MSRRIHTHIYDIDDQNMMYLDPRTLGCVFEFRYSITLKCLIYSNHALQD